jgi:rubredoxin
MRKMVWVKSVRSESWACSECTWAFNPSGPPQGATLDAMKENFELHRDKEFASHVCAAHPRTKSQKTLSAEYEPGFRRTSDDPT